MNIQKLQNLAISSLSRSRSLMHRALVASLEHIHQHGDRNALHNLVDGLKKDKANNSHLHRITVWLEDFGGMEFNKDPKSPTYKSIIGWQGKDFIQAHFERAKNTPWYEYKKPAAVKAIVEPAKVEFAGFSLQAELEKVVKAAQSMKELEPTLSADDYAKVHFNVDEKVIDALLILVGWKLEEALTDVVETVAA